jgi:hypothetical protein
MLGLKVNGSQLHQVPALLVCAQKLTEELGNVLSTSLHISLALAPT